MCSVNSTNRKQQKWRHQMRPINFGRVRVGLRESSETKEEPTQLDVFVATCRGRKGKELDLETQAAIEKVHDHQNVGETAESAFQAVFGKERLGRVRCFGRTITTTSLKREKEINKIKEHAKEKESLKDELKETNEKLQELHNLVSVLMQQSNPSLNIDDLLSAMLVKQSSRSDRISARDPIGISSTSTHIPKHA